MATNPKRDFLIYVDEMQTNTSPLLVKNTEVRLLINADTQRLGIIKKRLGNTKKGNTLTSTTSTSTSSSTSTSTSTSTS